MSFEKQCAVEEYLRAAETMRAPADDDCDQDADTIRILRAASEYVASLTDSETAIEICTSWRQVEGGYSDE